MGLSTSYANIVLIVVTVSMTYVLMDGFGDYFIKTDPEVKGQTSYLKQRLDTSINLASVSTPSGDVILWVINDGKTTLDVNCTDLYLDRDYVARSAIDEMVILNTSFDPGLWNPDEWVRITTTYATDDGNWHEARVVTCNGVSDSKPFFNQ